MQESEQHKTYIKIIRLPAIVEEVGHEWNKIHEQKNQQIKNHWNQKLSTAFPYTWNIKYVNWENAFKNLRFLFIFIIKGSTWTKLKQRNRLKEFLTKEMAMQIRKVKTKFGILLKTIFNLIYTRNGTSHPLFY